MLRLSLRPHFLPRSLNAVTRSLSQNTQGGEQQKSNEDAIPDVEGLSQKCVNVPNSPVGPNAAKDKEYKNPEYFCYNVMSFAEAEVEMEKFRLSAPSNKHKFTRNL